MCLLGMRHVVLHPWPWQEITRTPIWGSCQVLENTPGESYKGIKYSRSIPYTMHYFILCSPPPPPPPPVFLHGSVAKANNSWISTLSRTISYGRLNISSIWDECLKHLIQTTKWLYLIRWTHFLVRMAELLMLSHTSDWFIRPYDIATITSS